MSNTRVPNSEARIAATRAARPGRLVRLRYRLSLRARVSLANARRKDSPAWFVHQMGKVGSTSVEHTLRQLADRPLVSHTHWASADGLARETRFFENNYQDTGAVNPTLWAGIHLRWMARRTGFGEQVKLITMVRDPVARNLSSFFETLGFTHPMLLEQPVTEELVGLVHDVFWADFDHDLPLRWFDEELAEPLGVDVLAAPFDHQKGYRIIEDQRVPTLLLRMEDLTRVGPEALSEFLGYEDVEMIQANVAAQKPYAELYRRFMASLEIPESYLARLYDSPMASTLYSAEERDGFRARWMERAVAG